MASDHKKLQEALRLGRDNAILSKEVGVGMLAAAGMAVSPLTFPSGILAIGALVRLARNYCADRRKIMGDHAMSWIFELAHQGRLVKPF